MSVTPRTKVFFLICIVIPGLLEAVLILNELYNDSEALHLAHTHPRFKPVVLIDTPKGSATGVLINVPDKPDLTQRVILTNAHVIQDGVKKIYLEGLAPDADSEDDIDDSKNLAFISSKAHPSFKKNEEDLRKYDYGVVVLEKALDIEPLELTDEQLATNTSITIVGYGQKTVYKDGVLSERPTSDLKKRAFKSTITEIKNEEHTFYTHINGETMEKFVFPYEGDSGAPVFHANQEDSGVILGIVSGFINSAEKAAYISPTIEEVSALLD